ncbi:unnamed protein product, partial [Ectocarpus sp. 4 AP-2014]
GAATAAGGGERLPVTLDPEAEEAATASIAACSAAAAAGGLETQDSKQPPARDVAVAPASSSSRSLSLRPRSASANFFRRSAFFAQSPTFLPPQPPPPLLRPEPVLPLPEEPTLPSLTAALLEQAAPPVVGCNQRVSRPPLPPS